MAYRFKLNEPIAKGAVRIGREQLERAIIELRAERGKASAIHETRKCLKRTRALLRLIRPGLKDETFRDLNGRLRDIGKLLSSARDKEILRETAAKLELASGQAKAPAFEKLKAVIEAQRQSSGRVGADATAEAAKALRDAVRRVSELSIQPGDFTCIERGIAASIKRARQAYAKAYAHGEEEAFHEWRKAVQLHWRHAQLVSRAWPEMLAARVALARRLSQILGDDHDLAILKAFVASLARDAVSAAEAQEIQRYIAKRQKELRDAAEPRGQILLSGGAKGYGRRLGIIWAAAQTLAKVDVAGEETDTAAAPKRRPPAAKPKPKTAAAAPAPSRPAAPRPAAKAAPRVAAAKTAKPATRAEPPAAPKTPDEPVKLVPPVPAARRPEPEPAAPGTVTPLKARTGQA